MERIIPKNGKKILTQDVIPLIGSLVARNILSGKLGMQYGLDRDLYQALGYPELGTIEYADYWLRYSRQDIAKAIIDRPVKATWQGAMELLESGDPKDTPLEKEWKKLRNTLQLKTKFARVDRLASIGKYAVLLLGLDDIKKNEEFALPVRVGGALSMKYVKPFGELSARVTKSVDNPRNERYGLPEMYTVTVGDVGSGGSYNIDVHYTRVLHIVTDTLESEVEGIPMLEAVFNRLMDLEKIVGGDAEMFWRSARPGFKGVIDKDYQRTAALDADMKDQLDEYEHNLRRFLMAEGVDIQALEQQIADPANHVDIQLQMISAVTGIPKRILTGSERGELSSAQDTAEWSTYVQARRAEHAELLIVRPFVDRCIELKILPAPKDDYVVKWPDLFALSEKSRVEVGKDRALALRDYTTNPMAEAMVPPDAFLQLFLGLSTEQIELVMAMRDKSMGGEEALAKMIKESLKPPEPAPVARSQGTTAPRRTSAKPTNPIKVTK